MQHEHFKFSLPANIQPLAGAQGWRIEADTDKPASRALLRRVQREPEEVLEDIVFSHYATDPAMRCPPNRYEPAPVQPQDVQRAAARLCKCGVGQSEALTATEVAQALGVAAVKQLGECLSPYCSMTRLRTPAVRKEGQAELTRFLRRRFSRRDTLSLAFVGTGGAFAETALMADLAQAGYRHVEANFVEKSLAEAIGVSHGLPITEALEQGYTPQLFNRQTNVLSQVATLLEPAFSDFTLRAFADGKSFVDAVAVGEAHAVHATVCLDPGLDGIFTLDVTWTATLIARHAAQPGGVLAVAYAGAPAQLTISEPPRAGIGDYARFAAAHTNPAYLVGRSEKGSDDKIHEAMQQMGPTLLELRLRPQASLWAEMKHFIRHITPAQWGALGAAYAATFLVGRFFAASAPDLQL